MCDAPMSDPRIKSAGDKIFEFVDASSRQFCPDFNAPFIIGARGLCPRAVFVVKMAVEA
jgi:hypothetical protein